MRPLATSRLVLRTSTPEEFETLHHILQQEIEGPTFTPDAFEPEFGFDRYLAHQPLGQYFGRPGIYRKPTKHYIGYCMLMLRLCRPAELSSPGERPAARASLEAEIGWAIASRYRSQGYATEAGRALLAYAFEDLNLPRVVAFTEQHNHASVTVMLKLGMRLVPYPDAGTVVGIVEQSAR